MVYLAAMDAPVLRTKLYIPGPQPGGLVTRPRLLERLNAGLECKLTLISAPAGAGKTTLLSDWHINPPGHEWPLAWISFDEGDNDPVRFWTYVIAALETIQPGIGANILPLLQSPQPSPIEWILTLLINDLATIAHNFALVLDDYHLIENETIHNALAFLVDHLPPPMRIILASRTDPALPLARWRAKRQLTELRAEDLRFTSREAALFFNQLMGLNLSVEQAAALETKTEGWIVGLQLAAISMQGQANLDDFITAFTGSHRYILDYMTEEILRRQPEHVRTFLLQTAILHRLTGSLCDAVTGRNDSWTVLEQLQRANLFIVPLDGQGQWYRYHQLFAELLRYHLQQSSPQFLHLLGGVAKEDVPKLHLRAAAWYEQAGLTDETINHTIAAQNFEQASRLILHHLKAKIARGEATVLLRWFQALPEEWVNAHAGLNLAYAWLLFFTGHLKSIPQRLQAVEQSFNHHQNTLVGLDEEQFTPPDVLGLTIGLRAQLALVKGDVTRVIELSEQALTCLTENVLEVRGIIVQNLAMAYWIKGDVEAANRLLGEIRLNVVADDSPNTLISLSSVAELKRLQGDCRQAFSLYWRILQLTESKQDIGVGIALIVGVAHAELGYLLYEWNELDAAEQHLRRGIELCEYSLRVRGLVAYIGLVKVLLARGDFAQAHEVVDRLDRLVQNLDSLLFNRMVILVRGRVLVAQGDVTAIRQWLQANEVWLRDGLNSQTAFFYIIHARALLALGDFETATALLNRLMSIAEAAKRTDSIIEILVLQAVTLQAQGNYPQALAALKKALALAEPPAYIRVFVDEGSPVAALLLKLLELQQRQKTDTLPSVEYINRLLTALGVDAVALLKLDPALAHPQIEPLTGRELEVFHLMAAGLSNPEIAAKLVVAKSTLKTHIKSIYGKLGVTSRINAIAKGKELNLL